jgi:hypothetical protein
MVVEEACGWVGRGHTTRIGLHQVPICGQRDAIGGEKGGKEVRSWRRERKRERGDGWARGKERGVRVFF